MRSLTDLVMGEIYGYSSVLDVKDCDPSTFTRESIGDFLAALCDAIDMEREELHFWDYQDDPEGYAAAPVHLRGTSAVQFIKTSSIVIHTLDDRNVVFIDLFSCKKYDPRLVEWVVEVHFKGKVRSSQTFARAY